MTKFEVWKNRDGWRWRFVAANGEIVASGESYKRRKDCVAAVYLLQQSLHADIAILKKSLRLELR